MIILNEKGFYKFIPEKLSELLKMQSILYIDFEFYKNCFIPKRVFDLQGLHAKGEVIDGITLEHTTDNIEDLLKKNELTYSFTKKRLAKISEITDNNIIGQDIYCMSSQYLIQAGSFIGTKKVISYYCRYNFKEFMYAGVELK